MLSFTEIKGLIPPQGQLSFTISEGRAGKLNILLHPIYPAIDDIPTQKKKDYAQARTPMIIKGSPEELDQYFMEILEKLKLAEDDLQTAFTKKEKAIQKAIGSTAEKKKNEEKGCKTPIGNKSKEEPRSKKGALGLFD